MDLQKYIIEVEQFGKFEIESNNVFFALDDIRKQTNARAKELIIISAFVILNNDFAIEITNSLNGD